MLAISTAVPMRSAGKRWMSIHFITYWRRPVRVPKRTDIKRVLVIGSGPIVIGQAAEFDYSGTQAIKALRDEGLEVVLVNSNPATIMTDPELADRTYVEPLTLEAVERIIAREKPDAILPTVGGQTALNLAVGLEEAGVLKKYGVRLIGASVPAIKVAEDRLLFRDAMKEIGLEVPASGVAKTLDAALQLVEELGFPAIIRPSFTMGGVGGGIAYNLEEFKEIAGRGLSLSPIHEILIEQSVIGWKEFELEVMRDGADNFVVICSIENIDPMGVHTGDSITVAPAQTLTDKEYQRMRDAARRVIRRVGVETGGSNIQFAINPADGRMVVIEMNPRVSRSSALASKATGFPIAKIAAKLALGYLLHEIPNDITRVTPASFEPTIDYVVVKIPRWNFEKFPQADRTLTTQMKSVGEAMAIGRTFKEAFLKGIRSLELGRAGLLFTRPPTRRRCRRVAEDEEENAALRHELIVPNDRRMWALFRALDKGWPLEQMHELTRIDPWFLEQFAELVELRRTAEMVGLRDMSSDLLRTLKRAGFGDEELGHILEVGSSRDSREAAGDEAEAGVQAHRHLRRRVRVVHAVSLQQLRRHLRGRSHRPAQGGDSRQRSESYRPGHRVRLLLLSRRVRLPSRRARDGDDQLQSRNRVDRLRHVGSALLRTADLRRRDGGHRAGARRQSRRRLRRAVRRADAAEAGAGAAGGRRHHPRHVARFHRSRRGSPALCAAAVGSRHPAAGERDGDIAWRGARGRGRNRLPGRGSSLVRPRRPQHGDRLRRQHARSLHGDRRRRVARSADPRSIASSSAPRSSTSIASPTPPAR